MLRREDRRLLTGQGQFVADLKLPDMLHAVFVRSQVAHARIRSVDLSRAASGARRRLCAQRRGAGQARCRRCPTPSCRCRGNGPRRSSTSSSIRSSRCSPTTRCGMSARRSPSSWPRAAISPKTRPSWSRSDLEPLPAVVDPEAALQPALRSCTSSYDTNLIGEFRIAKGDVEAALARAPHRLKRRFYHHRYAAMPMECRGVVGALRRTRRRDHDLVVLPGRALGAARGVHRAEHARGAHPLRRARRRRRFRRQGPRLSRGSADSVPRARRWSGRCAGSRTGTSISCAPAIRATRSTTSRSASTTTAGCSHSATASSSTAAPGIRSAPASPTTPRCTCPGRTSSTISPSTRASPRPTRCRTRPIAAPDGRRRRSRWSG